MNFTFENFKSYQYLHAQYISYMYMWLDFDKIQHCLKTYFNSMHCCNIMHCCIYQSKLFFETFQLFKIVCLFQFVMI